MKNNNQKKDFDKLQISQKTKRVILGSLFFLLAIILIFGFFDSAGKFGQILIPATNSLFGKIVYFLPLILILISLICWLSLYQKIFWWAVLAIFFFLTGISGFLEILKKDGGQLGYLWSSLIFKKLFGTVPAAIIFLIQIAFAILIFSLLLKREREVKVEPEKKPSLIKRIFGPKFKVKGIELPGEIREEKLQLKTKPIETKLIEEEKIFLYQKPPLNLLESERGEPRAGDIRSNALIIKKTLENFAIPVEMSEINIGPTVTQYTLKPAEGVKLSKITALSNDLALALASHPIRIEAPIPGRSLVGIEVPNKERSLVRLQNLISHPDFQNARANLISVLGRDVSGNPVFANVERMPHLLVAGATGTGKTNFINSLILSLVYRNSPEILKFILVDPKRVEFPIYDGLPHLLGPIIYDAQKAVNALKWLILEMEKRFEILSKFKTRDIQSYNQEMKEAPLPYLVLIIDELADLIAARGREIEAGIVRLAQMARAVGIHLIVATQRPSVEVITGLIKANITSRVTFQVASQVDSRTVLDMAGAEKLLGLGDLLFVAAEFVRPRRIQAAYVTDKEVKRVVNWLKSKIKPSLDTSLSSSIQLALEEKIEEREYPFSQEDPLYEEAKKVVIAAKKASASLLQRKLGIGYARAARLIDILEQRGVVGPGEGAKPRKVYFQD